MDMKLKPPTRRAPQTRRLSEKDARARLDAAVTVMIAMNRQALKELEKY